MLAWSDGELQYQTDFNLGLNLLDTAVGLWNSSGVHFPPVQKVPLRNYEYGKKEKKKGKRKGKKEKIENNKEGKKERKGVNKINKNK